MQNFISPICTNPDVHNILADDSNNDKKDRNKLLVEICSAFNLKVKDIAKNQLEVHLVTMENHLDAGYIWTSKTGNGDTIYFYSNPLVSKQKGSANSSADTRDSKKIATLIANIRKQGEIPTEEGLSNTYKAGIRSAFRSIGERYGHDHFEIDDSLALIATKVVLGIDKDVIRSNIDSLQACYDKYMNKVNSVKKLESHKERFAKGATFIGVMDNTHHLAHSKIYYLVGEASFDTDKDEVTIHGGVKRYATLADTPLAGDAMIIRTYFDGKGSPDTDNELHIRRNDRFHHEIDIAQGYNNYRELFVLIPKHHE
jgi:hypothetical protein